MALARQILSRICTVPPAARTFAAARLLGDKEPTSVSTPICKAETTVSNSADTSNYVYGEGDTMVRLDWWNSGQRHTSWAKWGMLRDWRRRKLVAEYSDVRIRMLAVAKNDILPTAIKQEMEHELNSLPRYSDQKHLKNMCQITARRRGNVTRYRLSRFIFRDMADHGKLSGVIRAKWGKAANYLSYFEK